jgi:hypothetical protein
LGNFGSYLQGTTASLWALAGCFIILIAFFAQRIQICKQSEQIGDQKKQFQSESVSTRHQNFENQFFQLLNLHNQIACQMRQGTNIEALEGRGCFNYWYARLQNEYHGAKSQNAKHQNLSASDEYAFLQRCYNEWWKSHQEDLGHYFRTLYHLIKFVKSSDVVVTYEDKRRYTSLVRAQLSAYELAHLFYNGLSEYGKGFKPWIEEFGLLEHLDKKILLHPSHSTSYYDPRAFR